MRELDVRDRVRPVRTGGARRAARSVCAGGAGRARASAAERAAARWSAAGAGLGWSGVSADPRDPWGPRDLPGGAVPGARTVEDSMTRHPAGRRRADRAGAVPGPVALRTGSAPAAVPGPDALRTGSAPAAEVPVPGPRTVRPMGRRCVAPPVRRGGRRAPARGARLLAGVAAVACSATAVVVLGLLGDAAAGWNAGPAAPAEVVVTGPVAR